MPVKSAILWSTHVLCVCDMHQTEQPCQPEVVLHFATHANIVCYIGEQIKIVSPQIPNFREKKMLPTRNISIFEKKRVRVRERERKKMVEI